MDWPESRHIVLETRGILSQDVFMSLAVRVKGMLTRGFSDLPVVTCAASLAHHRLLGSVKGIVLRDDLTSVPAGHLGPLTSSVTGSVYISDVSGCDLVTILDSVQSAGLWITSQSLDREETQALVRAMESRVQQLGLNGGVTLDTGALTSYSGEGECRWLRSIGDTASRYRGQLRTWATSTNWEVTRDSDSLLNIQRM